MPLGTLKVTPLSERNLISHVIRELKISLHQRTTQEEKTGMPEREEDDSFTVFLLQFLAWPDHGTPSEPSEFLDLLFNISSYQVGNCITDRVDMGRTSTLMNDRRNE